MKIEIPDEVYEKLKEDGIIEDNPEFFGDFVCNTLRNGYLKEYKGRINHITFSVSHMNKSIEFYRSVFNAELLLKGEKMAYFDLNGLWLALNLKHDIPRNDLSYTHIAFSINEDDYEEILKKLKNLNVEVLEGRSRHTDEGRSIYFRDPDGHMFEFHTKTKAHRIKYYRENRKDLEFY